MHITTSMLLRKYDVEVFGAGRCYDAGNGWLGGSSLS